MSQQVRLRFAPSPTGALHIGGVRTALYNYLFAKKMGGTFILRIEDTDRKRFVAEAESYINEALAWLGLTPDEGVVEGGEYGPYRQSDRKAIYAKYAQQLLDSGYAYYAFDTAEELDAIRKEEPNFKYGAESRMKLRNSLTLGQEEVDQLVASGDYVVRILLPAEEEIVFEDMIRGVVRYNSRDMDDKVLYKGSEQMPTYHLANIVDDYLMKISHVVRGEEWLPSTPLHVMLYRYLGWEESRPAFAHLPLILKPKGNGKLSKRDAAKFEMPVFPLDFEQEGQEKINGFREWGFAPAPVLNFLALLGWHPEGDREMFSLEELVEAFDIEKVSKSGARFDFEKARWFSQQYLMATENKVLAEALQKTLSAQGKDYSLAYLEAVAGMLKERVHFLSEMPVVGQYFFAAPNYEDTLANEAKNLKKKVLKKWTAERAELFSQLPELLRGSDAATIKTAITAFMEANSLGFGDLLPFLRFALSGTMKGPDVFEMAALLGAEENKNRIQAFMAFCKAQ
ncbi:glutamyl-tRNA synthetase [Saprospira grandis DSM 2844]|uniref:Glutamate--tRNA ligase n=1 Tax=Saprospira grandis DSM 2844 TaxID=694433 RepID=J0P030_9BACT|nr:glutamyl-tRNA synthetase [Saprospira grandis DSM 2844]